MHQLLSHYLMYVRNWIITLYNVLISNVRTRFNHYKINGLFSKCDHFLVIFALQSHYIINVHILQWCNLKTYVWNREITQSTILIGRNVLQGGGTDGALIWIGVLGFVGGNVENGGRDKHRISDTNHRKAGTLEGRRDVGYNEGGGSEGSGRNPVVNNLHHTKTGDSGTVCGAAANIWGIHKGYGLWGGRVQEGIMVEKGGARDTAQGNLGGNIMVRQDETS